MKINKINENLIIFKNKCLFMKNKIKKLIISTIIKFIYFNYFFKNKILRFIISK